MKIRTDFVTNSSSSSFCVEIEIEDKNKEIYSLVVDPTDEYVGGGGDARLSVTPKKMFGVESVEELCDLLVNSITLNDAEFFVNGYYKYGLKLDKIMKILSKQEDEAISCFVEGVMKDADKFKKQVTENITSVEDIAFVRVRNVHQAWGEFSDLLENYLPDLGIDVEEKCEDPEDDEEVEKYLRKKLTADSDFEGLLECLMECYEPGNFSGYEEKEYDMSTKKVKKRITIDEVDG